MRKKLKEYRKAQVEEEKNEGFKIYNENEMNYKRQLLLLRQVLVCINEKKLDLDTNIQVVMDKSDAMTTYFIKSFI